MVIITSFDNVHSFRIHISFEKSVTTTTISTFYDTFTRVTPRGTFHLKNYKIEHSLR